MIFFTGMVEMYVSKQLVLLATVLMHCCFVELLFIASFDLVFLQMPLLLLI